MLATLLVFLATLVIVLVARSWMSRPKNAPPSPGLALPVVGHLYLFKGNPVEQLHTWRERLGDIYSIQMGPFRCVMLSGYELISEALLKHHEVLLGRPNNFSHEEGFQHAGIISLEGDRWKEQRAFLQTRLRALGMGKNIMAERIRVEADYLLGCIDKARAEPIDLSHFVMIGATNVICGVMFGKRFDHDDETINFWLGVVKRLFKLLGSSAEINFFPVLKYLPGDRFHYRELVSVIDDMNATLQQWIDRDNRKVSLEDEWFEDLVQAYLTEIERKKQQQGVTGAATSIDDLNLLSTAQALFNAGTETVTNTVVFAVLYMVNFPDTQERLYREIRDVVGTDRPPEVSDKPRLKYLAAFIMETQRLAGVIPLGLDRLATQDFRLGGYTVAAGTSVMINLDSALRDPHVWGDPDTFRPDRFLDDDGNVAPRRELIPFGVGKRNCLGEGLAAMELYLFLSALVQRFEFLPETQDQLPSMVPNVGFSRIAQPFRVRVVPREA